MKRTFLKFLLLVSMGSVGLASIMAPITARAVSSGINQLPTAVVNSSTALAISGTAVCTGGGADTVQTVLVVQGLTIGSTDTLSNSLPCDGVTHPWGIIETPTLGNWIGGTSVSSTVAFTKNTLTLYGPSTLSPQNGLTLDQVSTGGRETNIAANISGTASCIASSTATISVNYDQTMNGGASGSNSTSITCDGTVQNWSLIIQATNGTWLDVKGMSVANITRNTDTQAVGTETKQIGLAE